MTELKVGRTGPSCPCGNHAACVQGCALMDYPGYVVDYAPGHTHEIMPTLDVEVGNGRHGAQQ
jgi:hypothetical protein